MARPALRSSLQLLHYWWPLALGWSWAVVARRATGREWDAAGLATLLLGICAAYSLDRLVERTRATSARVRAALALATGAASAALLVVVPRLPRETAALALVLGAVAVCYPLAKRLPGGKTLALPLVWTWSALALPFDGGSWLGWRALLNPVAVPIFLLFAAGCVLCDLKDEARDRDAGVPTLPARYGAAPTLAVAGILAAAAAVAAIAEGRPGVAWSATVLAGTLGWPRLLATDVVGPLVVDVVLTLPGLLIALRMV
jgi:4-hydroxybenzoate polyprenyltransferase